MESGDIIYGSADDSTDEEQGSAVSLLEKVKVTPTWREIPSPSYKIAITLGLMLSMILAFMAGIYWPKNLDALCIEHADLYSPISKDLGLKYHDVEFESTLFTSNTYRDNASVEVDKAWHDLGVSLGNVIVSEEDGVRARIPKGNAKFPLDRGGGFLAEVQVFHQLHCVNFLRKGLWFNYDYYDKLGTAEFSNDEEVRRLHAGHCVDYLRQQLMCVPDLGFVTYMWVKDRPQPIPDFSTTHRCKDFNAIKEWVEERQVYPKDNGYPIRRPGDRLLDEFI